MQLSNFLSCFFFFPDRMLWMRLSSSLRPLGVSKGKTVHTKTRYLRPKICSKIMDKYLSLLPKRIVPADSLLRFNCIQ